MNLSKVKFCRSLALIAAATVIFVPSTLANQLEGYCISQVGLKWEEQKWPGRKRPLVSVIAQGETFHITNIGSQIQVTRPKEETPLAKIRTRQAITSHINTLSLGGEGLLWIDGAEIDYMARLDLSSKPPIFEKPIQITKLRSDPCPLWVALFSGCLLAQGAWSPTLNRAFISGHPVTLFGRSNPVGFEIIAGEAKPLPAELKGARFMADLPKLNGVLFRGPRNEAFLYDGSTVTNLLAGYSDTSGDNRPTWYHQGPLNGRFFLLNINSSEKNEQFMLELKAASILEVRFLPGVRTNDSLFLYTLPDDPRIWGISGKNVVAEIEGRFQAVMTIPDPNFIYEPMGRTPDGSIAFVVKNEVTEASTDYFIRHAGPTSQCQATLSAEDPIVIGEE